MQGRTEEQESIAAGASGYRDVRSGTVAFEGSDGCYWSASSYSATFGFSLLFTSGLVNPQYAYNRGDGFPLRCIQGFALRGTGPDERVAGIVAGASGSRNVGSGAMGNEGGHGNYWSASASGATYGLVLYFLSGSVNPQSNANRGSGHPLRCIQEFALHGTEPNEGQENISSNRSVCSGVEVRLRLLHNLHHTSVKAYAQFAEKDEKRKEYAR